MPKKSLPILACMAAGLLLACTLPVLAGSESSAVPQEYAVKAQFITKFHSYIDWPPGVLPTPGSNFTICVIGDSPISEGLAALHSQPIGTHPLNIEQIDTPKEADRCHLLFVAASEKSKLPTIISPLETQSILTVSDINGFARAGGMVEFVPVDGKVRFEINLAAARKGGLNIRSQLLALARDIYY